MKIALLGDIALIGRFTFNDEIKEYLLPVKKMLSKYDYVIANLEAPFIDSSCKRYKYKSVHLGTDVSNVKVLKYLGVTTVSLANNHIYDYGKQGLDLTIKTLESNGINYFGLNGKDYLIEQKDCKIALHGYCCYSSNPFKLGSIITPLSRTIIEQKLDYYKNEGFTNIISCHFGQEHVAYPSLDHMSFFRKLAKKYNFILHGHHPHVIQGCESISNSLIYYSLGNFCFDNLVFLDPNCRVRFLNMHRESLLVELNFTKDGFTREHYTLFWRDNSVILNDSKISDFFNRISSDLSKPISLYANLRRENIVGNMQKVLKPREQKYLIKRLNYRSFFILKDLIANRIKYNKAIK